MRRYRPMPTILLVEDNELSMDLMVRSLQREGYQTITACNGRDAVGLAGSDHPDLILMDLSIPEIDGWEATRRIKADPGTRAIPIIAVTAHAMEGDRRRALEAGCDDYDTKPANIPVLMTKIRRLLGQGGEAAAG